MTNRLREIQALRRSLPASGGCDSCKGSQSRCVPIVWVAPDGTETWTGTPEFCPDCGRDLWAAMGEAFPGGVIRILRIIGMSAEETP